MRNAPKNQLAPQGSSDAGSAGGCSPTHNAAGSSSAAEEGGRSKRSRGPSQGPTTAPPPASGEDQEAKLRRQQMLNKAAQQRYRCAGWRVARMGSSRGFEKLWLTGRVASLSFGGVTSWHGISDLQQLHTSVKTSPGD